MNYGNGDIATLFDTTELWGQGRKKKAATKYEYYITVDAEEKSQKWKLRGIVGETRSRKLAIDISALTNWREVEYTFAKTDIRIKSYLKTGQANDEQNYEIVQSDRKKR